MIVFPRRASVDRGATRGFTLAELLVVVVVVGILAAIAIPVFLSQADKASDASLKSDLASAAKLLQVAEANGETLPSEFAAGQVVDLGSAGTFTSTETLTVSGSGETLCVEGTSDSGTTYSADLDNGLREFTCSGIASNGLVTDGLVLHLEAGDVRSYPGSGSTWEDLSDSNIDGTLTNVTYDPADGGSMVFNGTNSRVVIDNPLNQPNLEQEWTVSAWVKKGSDDERQALVGGLNRGVHVVWSYQRPLLYLNCCTDDYYTYGSAIDEDSWFMITFRFNNATGERTIYKNTTNINTSGPNRTFTPSGQQATFTIGRSSYGDFEGNISHIVFYDRYISDAELQQNFDATRERYGV